MNGEQKREPRSLKEVEPIPFRSAVFGYNRFGVGLVAGPKTPEACGLYIHTADIDAYLKWAKQFESPNENLN